MVPAAWRNSSPAVTKDLQRSGNDLLPVRKSVQDSSFDFDLRPTDALIFLFPLNRSILFNRDIARGRNWKMTVAAAASANSILIEYVGNRLLNVRTAAAPDNRHGKFVFAS